MTQQTIPVLSLDDYTEGSSTRREEFVATLGAALADIGFFALEDHGIGPDLIRDAYAVTEELFNLPASTKLQYDLNIGGQRGYTKFGKEHAKNHNAPDLKEFWHVGRELIGKRDPEYPDNVWPKEVPQFQPIMMALYKALDECSMHLLDACSEYIAEERQFLRKGATDGNTVLRIIHYPPVPEDRNPSSLRAAPHEDINLITLLCESTAAGLELLKRDGTWLPVHSLKGQLIVDAGDMLQQLTNGLIRSTTHRVTNPGNSRERRFSIPFFVHPRSEVSLAARPQCIARTGGEKRFDDITAGEYLHQRLREIGLK